jgi:hypothetical protein
MMSMFLVSINKIICQKKDKNFQLKKNFFPVFDGNVDVDLVDVVNVDVFDVYVVDVDQQIHLSDEK